MKEINQYLYDIVFVILHYNTIKETENCIQSIKENIDTDLYHIIVVDNCSPNNTGLILQQNFKEDEKVTIIMSKENIGFARGNNIGIDYAKSYLHPAYICCLNNDTLLEQQDFFETIVNEYINNKVALIGPKVVLKNGEVQSFPKNLRSIKEYKSELAYYINKKSLKNMLKRLLKKVPCIVLLRNKLIKRNNRVDNNIHDVVLHGCCLIFTPTFFTKLNGFNEKTFLYREEELLYLSIIKNDLHTLYSDKVNIKHLEDAATDSLFSNDSEKNEFIRKHQIDSLKILISELKEYKNVAKNSLKI